MEGSCLRMATDYYQTIGRARNGDYGVFVENLWKPRNYVDFCFSRTLGIIADSVSPTTKHAIKSLPHRDDFPRVILITKRSPAMSTHRLIQMRKPSSMSSQHAGVLQQTPILDIKSIDVRLSASSEGRVANYQAIISPASRSHVLFVQNSS